MEKPSSSIVACAGHMFDRPNRKTPRFPHTLEARVQKEVRERLSRLNAQVGFSSLACGTDMIFAEAMLERGAQIHIVLPFDKQAFRKTSVDIIPEVDLGSRFEKILAKASSVTALDRDAGDRAAYELCNQTLTKMALSKGMALILDVKPLAVWDGEPNRESGGTHSFIKLWLQRGKEIDIIDLAKVLADGSAQ